jgi:rubredoxin-NAD+ reductase
LQSLPFYDSINLKFLYVNGDKVTEHWGSFGYTKVTKPKEEHIMKYVCDICGWVYDEAEGYPEGGIAPGTKWEDVPEDFQCPLCFVDKDNFSAE